MMNKRKITALLLVACITAALACGCSSGSGSGSSQAATSSAASSAAASSEAGSESFKLNLADGTYTATFKSDNNMFRVSDALKNKGTLTVKNGEATIHISLTSKNIVNLFEGKAEDAKKDGAKLLQPTVDTVKFDDGTTEQVNGFDVRVPYLDREFDLAIIGTKGTWYDHKVTVSNPEK